MPGILSRQKPEIFEVASTALRSTGGTAGEPDFHPSCRFLGPNNGVDGVTGTTYFERYDTLEVVVIAGIEAELFLVNRPSEGTAGCFGVRVNNSRLPLMCFSENPYSYTEVLI